MKLLHTIEIGLVAALTSCAPVIRNGQVISRLSINDAVEGAVSPTIMGMMCFDVERGYPI